MGYEWTHVNENEWLHQWCVLEMDGKIGYADANILSEGEVGYGEYEHGRGQSDQHWNTEMTVKFLALDVAECLNRGVEGSDCK